MDNKKNIVLIGMMGAGKSTIGHLLDEKLGDFLYVDLDTQIEKEAKKHIHEIFEEHGEAHFRKLEHDLIKRLSGYSNQVISTGGGVVENAENMDALRKNGVIFYLSATPEEIYSRVRKATHRPLLKTPNPLQTIKEIMKRREKFYQTADFEVSTENKTINEITDEIIKNYNLSVDM